MTTTPDAEHLTYPPIPESICHTLGVVQDSTVKKIDRLTKDIEQLETELAYRRAELDEAFSFNQDLASVLGPVTE
ncbi:MAG TPA: hypothetical protein VMV41_16065 [Cellulomonadaceae bacterium]|nr:hypothetical protein [Cellulomonadaceae bacterium]